MADELCFLGRGAGFYTREGNTSAFFKSGEEMLLIDCGETVFGQLTEQHLLDGVRKLRIIITHLHSDHCGSLGTLGLYWYFSVGHTMELVVPPEKDFQQDLITLMRLYGVPREAFFLTEDAAFGSFAGIRDLRFIPTLHAPDMTCFSLQWISLKGPVFYSADTCEGEPVARFIRDHEDFDRIYMDATNLDFPGNVHLPLQKLAQMIPAALRDRVFLMHLNSPDCEKLGQALGFCIVKSIRRPADT